MFGPKASTGPTMSAFGSSRRNAVEAGKGSAPDPAQVGYGSAEPKQHDDDSDESNDEDGWVEEPDSDEEQLSFKSFCDSTCFKTLDDMISYDNKEYGFDLPKLLSDCGFNETFEIIKAVNFLRTCKAHDLQNLSTAQLNRFKDEVANTEKHFKPVIVDDGVLIEVDDLLTLVVHTGKGDDYSRTKSGLLMADHGSLSALNHVELIELVGKLVTERDNAVLALKKKQDEYDHLAGRFEGHRELMESILDKKWDIDDPSELGREATNETVLIKNAEGTHDRDAHYYASYAHHDIHEVMLADKIRTDGYRDFVYEHKHLFAGKVVLDVGCGTGILSMFCAKAGAKHVYAVDNSDIIQKAKKIIKTNGFAKHITCIHGKVEHLALPEKVDIIISEWMGYGLLYEAMLDSILVARDRLLVKGGLMIPSHTKLFIAPFSEPSAVPTYKAEWGDVYGFDMTTMMHDAFNDVHISRLSIGSRLLSQGSPFHDINVSKAKRPTSSLENDELFIKMAEDGELTGFCIWFDVIFMTHPTKQPVYDSDRKKYDSSTGEMAHSFSTGPNARSTHWHQLQLTIDYGGQAPQKVVEGDVVSASIKYLPAKDNEREIDIEMEWRLTRPGSYVHRQLWQLR